MRIVHVIPNSNKSVIETFIKFVNDYFNDNRHTFIIIRNGKSIDLDVLEYRNVSVVSSLKTVDIINITNNNDKVIFHYLKLKTSQMFLMLFYPGIFKKIFWVAWGADLYQWKKNVKGNILRKVKIKVKNSIASMFRRRINYFVGIFPPDIEFFKREFSSRAQTFYASYLGGLDPFFFQKQLNLVSIEEKIKNNECINIQIGHSSTKILKHLEVLENLSKYRNENIKIYIPLSYGDKEYGDHIQKVAIQLFGDKAICMRELINKDDYMKFLSTIDITIFNTSRQIGLGNLIPLLYMEKKIFIPQGSVMYDFYKDKGINICDYMDININDYNNFIKPINMSNGKEFVISNELNTVKKIEMWSRVFDTPLK